jgi:flavin reductase (DIM6/NTAB) family NADH-FMN oxidoreductase RutF
MSDAIAWPRRRRRLTDTTPDDTTVDIDALRFRDVLGRYATGVVAVTAFEPGSAQPVGLAVNSFTSVSLRPALVSFCIAQTSTTWPRLREASRLCVNILGEAQRPVAAQLAAKRAEDRFTDLRLIRSPGGAPVIAGSPAWLECAIDAQYEAGDHVIVVARVHHLERAHDGGPLVFFRGGYGRFHPDVGP